MNIGGIIPVFRQRSFSPRQCVFVLLVLEFLQCRLVEILLRQRPDNQTECRGGSSEPDNARLSVHPALRLARAVRKATLCRPRSAAAQPASLPRRRRGRVCRRGTLPHSQLSLPLQGGSWPRWLLPSRDCCPPCKPGRRL